MMLSDLCQRMPKSFIIVWLDSKIDEHRTDYQQFVKQFQYSGHSIKRFISADECVDYLTDIENEKVYLIVSQTLAEQLIPLVKDICQIYFIYVFCNENNVKISERWIYNCSKVKDVLQTVESVSNYLKEDINRTNANLTSIDIVSLTSDLDLNKLNPSFMYSQLLKEILLKMEYNEPEKQDFIDFCLIQQVENEAAHSLIDEFEQKYDSSRAIYWYTRGCFIFDMLNRALREQNIDIIMKMGFFIRDLHQQIERLHSNSENPVPSTVYRGQGMFNAEFEILKKNKGGLLSFNCFLSTTTDNQVAQMYADSARDDPALTGVLFEVEIDSSISTTPYTSVDNNSYYNSQEKEILFTTHSVFRISGIESIENRLWHVKLTLTRDTDEDLIRLANFIRQEIDGQITRAQLGNLMLKMKEYNKAEEIYRALLTSTSDSVSINDHACLHNNIGLILTQKNDLKTAVLHLKKGLEQRERNLPPNHPDLAASHLNMGELYDAKGEFQNALFHYKKALEILQQYSHPSNHRRLAIVYNNIGEVYRSTGNIADALHYHTKAFDIRKENLPLNDPDLAVSYNNIGLVYQAKGQHQSALSYMNTALEIIRKSLSSNHSDLATMLNNIGESHMCMRDYSSALQNHQEALELQKKYLSPTHPDIGTSYKHIGLVYYLKGEYSTALINQTTALKIFQQSLSPEHPDLARTHGNLGLLYHSMGSSSLALSHLGKALDISRNFLPSDHGEIMMLQSTIATIQGQQGFNRFQENAQSPSQIRNRNSSISRSNHLRILLPEDPLD